VGRRLECFVRAVVGLEWWVLLGLELERRRRRRRRRQGRQEVRVRCLLRGPVVGGLWVEEGSWSARRGLGQWTGGGFRRFCGGDGSCWVRLWARSLCLGL